MGDVPNRGKAVVFVLATWRKPPRIMSCDTRSTAKAEGLSKQRAQEVSRIQRFYLVSFVVSQNEAPPCPNLLHKKPFPGQNHTLPKQKPINKFLRKVTEIFLSIPIITFLSINPYIPNKKKHPSCNYQFWKLENIAMNKTNRRERSLKSSGLSCMGGHIGDKIGGLGV